jgi:predicted transcriptional regulator
MPVTLLYGPERALVARLVLSLLRTVRKVYTPELTLEEASEFLFLMMHLFIGHVQGRPLSASRLARIAEMPRTTALRRITALIELGYLERVGNSYYLTAKANVPNQRRVLLGHINHIQHAAKELSKMDIPPLTKSQLR